MALRITLVTTVERFVARVVASRLRSFTLDGRFQFCQAARTRKWLQRHISAGFTKSKVTELIALMLSTLKCLSASLQAKMLSKGIEPFLGWAT